jgi:hypothetical protein
MAFNGSGTFNRLYNWVTDRNNSVKIQADRMDGEMDGMATGLSSAILKDGQQTLTANIPWGGFKITNLGDATSATDALNRQAGDARYHPIGAIVTTDNAVARYNGTVGATQNSGVIIDDSNNVTGVVALTTTGAIAGTALSTTGSGVTARTTHTSTDAGAAVWPAIVLDRFSATPAASDNIAGVIFRGRDNAAGSTDYVVVRAKILDTTDTSEDGQGILAALVAGADTAILTWGPGVQIGAPTGGDKGANTLNATTLYEGGSALSALYQGLDAELTAIAGLVSAADRLPYYTGSGTASLATFTTYGRSLVDDADAATARGTLGLATVTVDNTLPRFDSTAGAMQTSGVAIDDSNAVTGVTLITVANTDTSTSYIARSTDAGSALFVGMLLDRNSATPAANDFISDVRFRGRDSGANTTDYAAVVGQIIDATDGSEDGRVIIRAQVAGVNTDIAKFDSNGITLASGNTAAEYSTSTFTPTVTLVGGAGNTVPVYTTNTGRYSRIGNRVFVDVYLNGDGGAEGAGTGTITIALPVAASASAPGDFIFGGAAKNGTAEYPLVVDVEPSATTAAVNYFDLINNRSAFTGDLQNNTNRTIRLNFNYEA